MSKLKIILLVVVSAPLLVYGSIKGYVYYSVRSQLQDMIALVSPLVEVSYGGIGSSLNGRFRVEDILVHPHGVNEAIRIDAVELQTPGLGFLLAGGETIRREGFPKRLGSSIRGLHLDLDGPIMSGLMSRSDGLTRDVKVRADGLACGWRKLVTPESFRDLGYSTLSYDVELLLLRPGQGDELEVRFATRAHDLQYFQLELRLMGIAAALFGGDPAGLRMKSLSVRSGLDPGYVGKALDYCAEKSNVPVKALLETLAGQDDEAYMADLGFVPGNGIRSALVSYFLHPGEVQLNVNPPWAVGLDTLQRYQPQDLPGRLNLSVSVDQEKISDLSFTTASPGTPNRTGNSVASSSEPPPDSRRARRPERRRDDEILRNGSYYQPVAEEQLPDLLGRDIWVLTSTGLEREGRLVKVKDGIVWLTLRMRGGSMTTRVALAETKQLALRTARR